MVGDLEHSPLLGVVKGPSLGREGPLKIALMFYGQGSQEVICYEAADKEVTSVIMGDTLRDYYNQEYQKLSAIARHKARAAYTEEDGTGTEALRARESPKKKGYRPPASQRKMNLDG